MLELNQRRTTNAAADPQPRRLMLALALLLIALAAILIKDRQFWFGAQQSQIEADAGEPAAASQTAQKLAAHPTPTAAHAAKKQIAATVSYNPAPTDAPIVATNRTVLPPLDVEVIAGDTHRNVHPGSNATKLEIGNQGSAAKQPALAAPTKAAERQAIAEAVPPAYPPLAQHMNVQGAVVLQALIGADGSIQNLRVLTGPAILASAAQQAVLEWRFKPIVQNGQAVESKATITVNFSIKVADNSATATLAETRAADTLIITR